MANIADHVAEGDDRVVMGTRNPCSKHNDNEHAKKKRRLVYLAAWGSRIKLIVLITFKLKDNDSDLSYEIDNKF